MEHRMVQNTRAALTDRRDALINLYNAKSKADVAAAELLRVGAVLQSLNRIAELSKLEYDSQRADEFVAACDGKVEEVGQVLLSEVTRIGIARRVEWMDSLKTAVAELKICSGERAKLWESAKQTLEAGCGKVEH